MRKGILDMLTYFRQDDRPVLPEGYAAVDYLESTGVQYIDTGVAADADTAVDIDFKATYADNIMGILGQAADGSRCYLGKNQNPGWQIGMGSAVEYVGNTDTARHSIRLDIAGKSYTFDGIVTPVSMTFTPSATALPLFAWVNQARVFRGRVYSFSIEKNGSSVMRLVPAVRLSDTKPGLYDTVGNVFLVNQGIGEDFLYG